MPLVRTVIHAFVVASTALCMAASDVTVTNLTCEYMADPLGIDTLRPRLSWILESDTRGQTQMAYQIVVASTPDRLNKDRGDLWDTFRVRSDQSVHLEYAGKALASYTQCYWKVRVWDKDGNPSEWSKPARWTMGILDESLWQGRWLAFAQSDDLKDRLPAPVFRKDFKATKPVQSAFVYICGLGYHELRLNGEKVGDHVLDPAFTRYDRRALYVTHEVTEQLKKGANALGVILGNGWLNVPTQAAWDFNKAPWRMRPRMLAQLRIVYEDGSIDTVVSDNSWKAATGPITDDAIRQGEHYDARKEMAGWDSPGFDDDAWAAPQIVDAPKGRITAQNMPAMKVTETLKPVKVAEPKPGVYLFDLGQNIAGWVRLAVQGPAGTKVTLRYGERLKPDGSLEQKEIHAHVKDPDFQTDSYTLKGVGRETWEPRFVYHGFQYVELTGFPGKPTLDTITGKVVHTAFESAGRFECSNDLINKIQQATLWSYRGNYHGYPTDCPHREKNGWTGDAHLACEQAMFNWHNAAAYTKWMNDFYDEQRDSGELPGIVPTGGWGYAWGNGPAWDSAYLIIPWTMYKYCEDKQILEAHFDRFKRYVDYLTSKADNHIVSIGLGDWVPAKTETPVPLTSTAFYHTDVMITGLTARILGKPADEEKYLTLAAKIREAFNKTFYKGDGIYANGSQTALSFALFANLVPEEEREKVIAQLVKNVEAGDYHIDTGILGAKCIFNVLSENGHHDVAWKMATQTTPPSYGDWINRGATTLWEDWPGAASLNHIMFGDISAWFYKNLGGISRHISPFHFGRSSNPYRRFFIIHPRPAGDLKWAKAEYESPWGTVRSSWRIEGDMFILSVTLPVGTEASVRMPAMNPGYVTEGGKPAPSRPGIRPQGERGEGVAAFLVTSGTYEFKSPLP